MLVTDPKQRASLQEIMNHPWMIKGFGSPPENYLPAREPLQLPLDPTVIHAMTGFDFGPPELIQKQLTHIIQSEDYQRAARLAVRERELQVSKDPEKKRGFGFDFYKRRSSTTSRDTLTTPSSEGLQLGNDPINAFHPLVSVYYLVREKHERDRQAANPGATSMPRSPGEAALQMPEIPAPKAAYTNAAAYEMPGEKATGGRSRPRARTHGEDEVEEAMKHVKVTGPSEHTSPTIIEPPTETPAKKESAAATILRRLSTRRKKDPADRSDKYYPPMVTVQSPSETPPSTLRKSFSVRRTRDRSRDVPPTSILRSGSSQPHHSELLTPPQSADNHRKSKGLGRSASVNSAEYRRRHDDAGSSDGAPRETYRDPPPTSGSDHSNTTDQRSLLNDPEGASALPKYNEKTRDTEQKTNLNPRSAAMRAKSLGHARRESIQARRAKREEAREANLPEETEQDIGEHSGVSAERFDSAENVKPVFLKGLFSVSTTSTKPVSVIRSDIIRVLQQLGVEYTEIRGGFSCRHLPSIDLKKVVDMPLVSPQPLTPGHRRRISFGGFNLGGGSNQDREDFRDVEKIPPTPKTPRKPAVDTSYTNSDVSDESVGRENPGGSSRRAIGETSTHVQSELGGSMILEFEIFIVKVPLLSLHGIQFKRLAGGTWQYKSMADQILRELHL
jgi:serine/threonine protein kinase KIN1/2